MKPRRRARCLTLEILYESDLAEHNSLLVLQRRVDSDDTVAAYLQSELGDDAQLDPLGDHAIQFSTTLLTGIKEHLDTLNTFIIRYAPEWPLEQIAVIDRNILRIAMYEILVDQETPTKVAINEAVELAKMYGSDSAPRFVNGVLGTLTEKADELKIELLGELAVS